MNLWSYPSDSDQNDLVTLPTSVFNPGFCISPFDEFHHSLLLCLGASLDSQHRDTISMCVLSLIRLCFPWFVCQIFTPSFIPCLIHPCVIREACALPDRSRRM